MSPYLKQNGFVLLIVLIFMQVFVLLNWYGLENIFLNMKLSKNAWAHEFLTHQAKRFLQNLEAQEVDDWSNCIIPFVAPSKLAEKSLEWWQLQACSGNFQTFQYYYVVEQLTLDACAVVGQAKTPGAIYFRISLFMRSSVNGSKYILQSTIVRPEVVEVVKPCLGVAHNVQPGRQSLRELNY